AEERAMLAAHEKRLHAWAKGCPESVLDKATLVSAEIAWLDGNALEAERLYDKAIRTARENGLVQDEAIANERAARLYQERGLGFIANSYLWEAHACYARLGADGKVRDMEHQYPHLMERRPVAPAATFVARPEQLDLLSIMK